jgi:hypothetical protein
MAIIQNLIARLTADTRAFEKARKSLRGIATESARTQKSLLGIAKGALAFAGIGVGIYGVKRAISSITDAVITQEKAEIDLAAAIGETDLIRRRGIADLKAYAASLQKATVYGDEEILSQMAYAANLGVTTDRLREAAKAAIGLAAKYRIDLRSAMMLIGRASQGQTQMLTRYGIILDATLSDEEKFNALLKIGAESMALATAETKSAEGAVKQLANTWSDFKEDIGPGIIETLKAISQWVKDNDEDIKTAAKNIGSYTKTLADAFLEMSSGFKSVRTVIGTTLHGHRPDYSPQRSPIENQRLAEERARGRISIEEAAARTPLSDLRGKGIMPLEQRRMSTQAYESELRKFEAHVAKFRAKQHERQINKQLQELDEFEKNSSNATIDVTAAYVRMYDSIDSRTVASFEARKKFLQAEFAEYEKTLGKSVELDTARQEGRRHVS